MLTGRQARTLLALLSLTASLCACSALIGFSGLAGDAPVADAATETGTATDAFSPAADGGAQVDAASTDSAPVRTAFCADAAGLALCDDFDDASARLMDTWDTVSSGGGAVLVRDTTASISPPASLLATSGGGGSNSNGAFVMKTFSGHTRALVSTDIRLEAFDKSAYGAFVEIHLAPYPDGFSDYRTALIYTNGQMTLDVYAVNTEGGTTSASVPVAHDFSQWQRVSLELAMLPMPHTTLYDDTGAALATLPMPAFDNSSTRAGQYVMVGLTYLKGNAMPWTARHDNVTVVLGD